MIDAIASALVLGVLIESFIEFVLGKLENPLINAYLPWVGEVLGVVLCLIFSIDFIGPIIEQNGGSANILVSTTMTGFVVGSGAEAFHKFVTILGNYSRQ